VWPYYPLRSLGKNYGGLSQRLLSVMVTWLHLLSEYVWLKDLQGDNSILLSPAMKRSNFAPYFRNTSFTYFSVYTLSSFLETNACIAIWEFLHVCESLRMHTALFRICSEQYLIAYRTGINIEVAAALQFVEGCTGTSTLKLLPSTQDCARLLSFTGTSITFKAISACTCRKTITY
jgi:hypothetical protein